MCRGEKRLHATFQVASVESRKDPILHGSVRPLYYHLLYRDDCNKTIAKENIIDIFDTAISI